MSIIISDNDLDKIASNNIVLAGGCFDILHPAHLEFMKKAKAEGDKLVILLESDQNIRNLKGKSRPLNNQITRAENLSKTNIPDFIVLLQMPTSSKYYYNIVKLLRPAIIAVTKGDPLLEVKKEQSKSVGGKVVEVMNRNAEHSTSKLIKQKY